MAFSGPFAVHSGSPRGTRLSRTSLIRSFSRDIGRARAGYRDLRRAWHRPLTYSNANERRTLSRDFERAPSRRKNSSSDQRIREEQESQTGWREGRFQGSTTAVETIELLA